MPRLSRRLSDNASTVFSECAKKLPKVSNLDRNAVSGLMRQVVDRLYTLPAKINKRFSGRSSIAGSLPSAILTIRCLTPASWRQSR